MIFSKPMKYLVIVFILFFSCSKDKAKVVVDTSRYSQLIIGSWKEILDHTSDDFDSIIFNSTGKYFLYRIVPWLNPNETLLINGYSYTVIDAKLILQVDSLGNTKNHNIIILNENKLSYEDDSGISFSWNK